MVSTSGAQLLPQDAIKDLREQLLPVATVLTPNVPEAMLLLRDAGQDVRDPTCIDDLVLIAKAVQELGPQYVLLKGGHIPLKKDGTLASAETERELIVDLLYGEGEVFRVESTYQQSKNTHGTGCSLACMYLCWLLPKVVN
jgi:hydroxymethylpyrimidine kinase/phosphomethylpyrimidine kinase